MKPLISVIIPAYNSANTIGTAIKSMIDQTWKNLEILVIDDNSTDDTKTVVEKISKTDPRVHYFKVPNEDPERFNKRGRNINAGYSARNFGFGHAKGDYITFQDADDASFINRIEFQYDLLKKYAATHVCIDWQKFDEKYLNKMFDGKIFMANNLDMVGPEELFNLAKKTKGVAFKLLGSLNPKINFEIKRARVINKLFFQSLDNYPGTGNSPLFKHEVIDKVKFRKLSDRIWPSFTGRGSDRDFNFQVAETFHNSYVFFIPMYMWRQNKQNERYHELSKYIVD